MKLELKDSWLNKYAGLYDLTKDVQKGALVMQPGEWLVVMVGRAEVLNRKLKFPDGMNLFITALIMAFPAMPVLFTRPLPRPEDNAYRVRRILAVGNCVRIRYRAEHNVFFVDLAPLLL